MESMSEWWPVQHGVLREEGGDAAVRQHRKAWVVRVGVSGEVGDGTASRRRLAGARSVAPTGSASSDISKDPGGHVLGVSPRGAGATSPGGWCEGW